MDFYDETVCGHYETMVDLQSTVIAFTENSFKVRNRSRSKYLTLDDLPNYDAFFKRGKK